MTQFNPTNRMPRPRFTTTLPSGPSVGLQAAGIEDPVVGRDPAAEQLQGAISEFTRTVNIAGNIASRNAETEERAAARAERDQYKSEKEAARIYEIQRGGIMRGIASTAREDMPRDIEAIKKGTLAPSADDQNDPELFLERLATERTIDVPEEFREEAKNHYRSLIANRTLNALYAKQDSDRANAQRVAFGGVTDELLILDDPAKITGTLNRSFATIPGATLEDMDSIAADAMIYWAKQGTPEAAAMVEGFKSTLGKRKKDRQEDADRILATAQGRLETQNAAAFSEFSAATRLKDRLEQRSLAETATKIINFGRMNGASEKDIERETKELLNDIEKADKEAKKQQFAAAIDNSKKAISLGLAKQAMSGNVVVFESATVGEDENGKPVEYATEPMKQDTADAIRTLHGWNGETGPTVGGWYGLSPVAKTSYVKSIGVIKHTDPVHDAVVGSMRLDTENIAVVTDTDKAALQMVQDLKNVDPTYAMNVADKSDEGYVAELASVLLQSRPEDVNGAILQAKSLFASIGKSNIRNVGVQEAQAISDIDKQIESSPTLLRAASVRARMYVYGKMDPKDAYAKAIADVRKSTMEVNGKLVPMGTIYTIDDGMKSATEQAAEKILEGRVKKMITADERIRSDEDNFTIERLNDGAYTIRHKQNLAFPMPRGFDPVIRVSEIELEAARIYQSDNPAKVSRLATLAELEAELKASQMAGPSGTDSNEERARGGGVYRVPSLPQTTTTKRPSRDDDAIKRDMAVRRAQDKVRKSQEQP